MLRFIPHNSTNEHLFVRSLVWVDQSHFIKLVSSDSMTPFFPLYSFADWFPAHHPWRDTMLYIHDEKLPTVSIDVAERGNLLLRTMPNSQSCCNSKPSSIIRKPKNCQSDCLYDIARNPEDCQLEWCNSYVSIVWLVPLILRIYYFIVIISDYTWRYSPGEQALAIQSRFCEGEHFRSFDAHS